MEMDLDLSLRLLQAGVASRYTPRLLALLEIYDGTKSGEVPMRDIVFERHRIYLEHDMFQQAGAALALAGRYEIVRRNRAALRDGRYRDASAAAAKGPAVHALGLRAPSDLVLDLSAVPTCDVGSQAGTAVDLRCPARHDPGISSRESSGR